MCIFIGHEKERHASGGWKEDPKQRYYAYLILKEGKLKNADSFTNGNAMRDDMQNRRGVLLGAVDLLYMPDEKLSDDDKVSTNIDTVAMTGERDDNSAVDVWPSYSIDAWPAMN